MLVFTLWHRQGLVLLYKMLVAPFLNIDDHLLGHRSPLLNYSFSPLTVCCA